MTTPDPEPLRRLREHQVLLGRYRETDWFERLQALLMAEAHEEKAQKSAHDYCEWFLLFAGELGKLPPNELGPLLEGFTVLASPEQERRAGNLKRKLQEDGDPTRADAPGGAEKAGASDPSPPPAKQRNWEQRDIGEPLLGMGLGVVVGGIGEAVGQWQIRGIGFALAAFCLLAFLFQLFVPKRAD